MDSCHFDAPKRAGMTDTRGAVVIESKPRVWTGPIVAGLVEEVNAGAIGKRKCGCLRTSEKLKKILEKFPSAPPPPGGLMYDKGGSHYHYGQDTLQHAPFVRMDANSYSRSGEKPPSKTWQILSELASLVQLAVTATALALYYLIYCYMQLVYYTLSSALYFHNADGPMKITIAVVTATSLIVGFNIMMRMEKILGIVY